VFRLPRASGFIVGERPRGVAFAVLKPAGELRTSVKPEATRTRSVAQ
jgi:hypothetical protein